MKTNGRTRVVVTGMGTINPIGKTLDEYWDGLIEGRSGARTRRTPTPAAQSRRE